MSTGQAAAEADARARLKDELKSAHWFLSQTEPSPFAELQVQRAALTATRLDLAALVPRRLPNDAFAAVGLGLLLAALVWMTPQLSRSWDAGHEAGTAERAESDDLRALLKDAPHDAEIEKLDLALRKLQQTGATDEEKQRALADARDAIDQANMEAAAVPRRIGETDRSDESQSEVRSSRTGAEAGSRRRGDGAFARTQSRSRSRQPREDPAIEPSDKAARPKTA